MAGTEHYFRLNGDNMNPFVLARKRSLSPEVTVCPLLVVISLFFPALNPQKLSHSTGMISVCLTFLLQSEERVHEPNRNGPGRFTATTVDKERMAIRILIGDVSAATVDRYPLIACRNLLLR